MPAVRDGTSSNGIFMPVRPASRKKSATTDQPHAESVPSEISVSIVAAAWRRFFHAATWNGQPAHSTTGVASWSASHCQCVNWSAETIPISRVGRESTAAKTSRRRSAAVGSSSTAAVSAFGSRAEYPTCSTASISASGVTCAGSYSTAAFSVA